MTDHTRRGPIGRPAAAILLSALKAYRLLLRAHLGNRCRFEPTCSMFALEAIERYGAATGSLLAAKRLLRCHPWCEAGFDPVPAHRPPLFGDWIGKTRRPAPASSPKTQP